MKKVGQKGKVRSKTGFLMGRNVRPDKKNSLQRESRKKKNGVICHLTKKNCFGKRSQSAKEGTQRATVDQKGERKT